MAKPEPTSIANLPKGVFHVDTQSRARTGAFDGMSVRINNAFTRDAPAAIAGNCTFAFKRTTDDQPDGPDVTVMHGDAVVPYDSVLVFKPPDKRSVRGFSISLKIMYDDKADEYRTIGAGDPGAGLCWSNAEFNCGPA